MHRYGVPELTSSFPRFFSADVGISEPLKDIANHIPDQRRDDPNSWRKLDMD